MEQHQPRAQAVNGPGNEERLAHNPKRFECTHPGCKKRFTRMEHMQRHALNHSAGESTCRRCNAHFKRPDLLARHMKRHQQRDLEAGGPGCGTLDTRKRAWRGPDGRVVDKRSRLAEPELPLSWNDSEFEDAAQVVSPPVSDEGRLGREYHFGFHDDGQAAGYYTQPAVPTSRPQLSSKPGLLEYPPAFQPDTASSFNMPYTTALDYNWLFNLESATASGFGLTSCGSAFQDMHLIHDQGLDRRQDDMAAQRPLQNSTPEPQADNRLSSSAGNGFEDRRQMGMGAPAFSPASSSRANNNNNNNNNNTAGERRRPPQGRTSGTPPTVRDAQASGRRHQRDGYDSGMCSPSNHHSVSQDGLLACHRPPEPEKPLSMWRKPDLLPQVSQAARERMLVVIDAANPNIPHQPPESPESIRDHSLLNLESIQSWLDLFFAHFNTAYPLIHMPTFDTDQAEPLLLLSIVLLGATYGDKNAHQLAVCIHDVIRPLIFAHAGFSPRPELWTLQTILLVECFGKSRAGQKQHDFSHLFHGLLINLIRRSDCQSIAEAPRPPPEEAGTASLDAAWKRWADLEQKKRLALLCFMWDTQHAVLFCQSLCMSAFELRCAMPCAQSPWESPNAESWATAWRSSEQSSSSSASNAAGPMFLPALKAYLSPTDGPETRSGLNALGLVLVLHGIMSVAWDMQRRDQTSLGVNSIIGTTSWRDRLGKAYDRWKADFDQYCGDAAEAAAGGAAAAAAEWKAFAAAYGAVYQAAQALLHMDFLDVQIYAGARHILGRPVQQQDYVRSSRVVRRWASRHRGRAAVAAKHAATMLCDVMAVSDQTSSVEADPEFASTYTNLFHVPWCLYLATLTAWAFQYAGPARKDVGAAARASYEDDGNSSGEDSDASDEIVWDAQKEMEALIRDMAGHGSTPATVENLLSGQGRKGIYGLVWVIADLLSKVRWGIVHAGVVVLRGLVPTRLINQYEAML